MPTVDDYARFFSGQISRQQIDALRERDGVVSPSPRRAGPAKRARSVAGAGEAPSVRSSVTGSDVDAFQRDALHKDVVERDTLRQRQVAQQIADQHAAALRLEQDLQRQELDRQASSAVPDPVDTAYDAYSVRTFDDF